LAAFTVDQRFATATVVTSTGSDDLVTWTVSRAFQVARVHGEIDLRTAEAVFERLAPSCDGTMLIVDLSDVRFLDSTGLTQLVRLQRLRRIRLVSPLGSQPRKVLELTQLVELIPTFDGVEDAANASHSGRAAP
jgi:anti-anti-sigma factor